MEIRQGKIYYFERVIILTVLRIISYNKMFLRSSTYTAFLFNFLTIIWTNWMTTPVGKTIANHKNLF